MLTYNPKANENRPEGYDKPFLLLILCLVWIVTGLWGHEPWKSDELIQIALVKHYAMHGLSWIPLLGGEPFLQTPPLVHWVAALSATIFSPWLLPFHDAARLSTGLFTALTLLGIGQATRLLYGARTGRLAVLVMLGTFGMVGGGHFLSSEIAALAGFSLVLWGCAASRSEKFFGKYLLATGIGLVFWSGSLFQAALAITLPFSVMISGHWRSPYYIRSMLAAALWSIALAALWPFILFRHGNNLLWQWLTQDGSLKIALAPFAYDGITYYLRRLSWFAFPALPLAAWTIWHKRKELGAAEHLCLTAFAMWLMALTLLNDKRDILALALLAPMAIAAGGGIDTLRRGAAAAMNWFGMLAFGLFGIYVWVAWSAATLGYPARLSEKVHILAPDFRSDMNPVAIAFAIVFSAIWVWSITRKRPLARQAITNWTLGVTLLWGLLVTLTMPWFDAVKSYKKMSESLIAAVPADYTCIDVAATPLPVRGALAYYGDLQLRHEASARAACELTLIRYGNVLPPMTAEAKEMIWEGSPSWARGKEWYRLFRAPR